MANATRGATRGAFELEPEVLLPSQFYVRSGLDSSLQPEKRLMLAVMEDAVGTFQKYACAVDRNAQRLFAEVEDWIASDSIDWPYSFVNLCHSLGLDVDFMRDGLRRWKQEQLGAYAQGAKVVRFPFRRVNGSRHAITGRAPGLRHIA